MKLPFPGFQAWVNTRTEKNNVIVVVAQAVRIFRLSASERDALIQSRDPAETMRMLLAAPGTELEMERINRVDSNEKECNVNFVFRRNALVGAIANRRFTAESVEMESSDDRDGVMTEMRKHLEPRLKFSRSEYSSFRAALPHAFGALFVALVTAGLVDLRQQFLHDPSWEPVSTRSRAMFPLIKKLVEILGNTGVIILGVIGVGLILIKMFKRISDPPIMLRLK